jgi:hypothetical protein
MRANNKGALLEAVRSWTRRVSGERGIRRTVDLAGVFRERRLDESAGHLLRSLFERRNQADYGSASMTLEEAQMALRDAEQFVDAVAKWIESETRTRHDEPG